MKYISFFIAVFLLSVCSCSKKFKNSPRNYPEYKLIIDFSKKIKFETGLTLEGYGINFALPKENKCINKIGNFDATYVLKKKKEDLISLHYARQLVVFLTENMMKEIDSNLEVRPYLCVFPATSNSVGLALYFRDEIQVPLGQGVAQVFFYRDKIKYEGFEIEEYTGKYPAEGKYYLIHEESYAEAAEIVKAEGPIFEMPKDAASEADTQSESHRLVSSTFRHTREDLLPYLCQAIFQSLRHKF